jgi:hypothetical protein
MKFFKEEEKDAPQINFDFENNQFSIIGKSFPEDSRAYYEPFLAWLEGIDPKTKELTVEMKLEYISSSSVIAFKKIFNALEKWLEKGVKITINWHYESDDEDLFNLGQRFDQSSKLKFNFIEH